MCEIYTQALNIASLINDMLQQSSLIMMHKFIVEVFHHPSELADAVLSSWIPQWNPI